MGPTKHMSESEKDFIKKHLALPDWTYEKIANYLGRSIATIKKHCAKEGLSKGNAKVKRAMDSASINTSGNLTDEQRKLAWAKHFHSSTRYFRLKKQYTDDQMDTFTDLWSSFSMQFEDIKPIEEDQMETLISFILLMDENRRAYKDSIEEEKRLRKILGDRSVDSLAESEDTADIMLYENILSLNRLQSELAKDFSNLSDKKQHYIKMLNASREQREKSGKISADTFPVLLKKLTEEEFRYETARYTSLMKIGAEKVEKDYKKPHEFGDGTVEPIIQHGKDYMNKSKEEVNDE